MPNRHRSWPMWRRSWPLSLPKCRRVIWLNSRRSVEIGVPLALQDRVISTTGLLGLKNNQVGWDLGPVRKAPSDPMASPQEGPVWCFFGTFRWVQQVLFLSHHIGCMVIESLNMMWTLIMILIEHHWTSYVPGCHPSCISIVCIPFQLNNCNMKTAMIGYRCYHQRKYRYTVLWWHLRWSRLILKVRNDRYNMIQALSI